LEERDEARAVFKAFEDHHEQVATAASLAIFVAYKVNRKKGNNGQTLFSGWLLGVAVADNRDVLK
jgi:hypothetical protein